MARSEMVSNIASLREKAGLTQLALSQLVGVTESTIANWEKGRSGLEWIDKITRLCQALECDLNDLIDYNESNQTSKVDELNKAWDIVNGAEASVKGKASKT